MNAYQFFLKNQSGSPSTAERIRMARDLADAERKARDAGYCWHWFQNGTWGCDMLDLAGNVVTSQHGIEFEGGKPINPGKRLIEAEMAISVLRKTSQEAI